MEKVVRKFKTFAEAEAADREFYNSLTPDERVDILLELIAQYHGGTQPRLERVCRVVKFDER